MQKNKNVVRSLASAVVAGILFSASSATMADDTAVASSILTLKFDPTIEIALIDDLSIENPELGDPAIGIEGFCVGGFGFTNYSITFDSSVNVGAFTLTDGSSVSIPYTVGFDNSIAGTFTTVTAGIPVTGQTPNAFSCADATVDNARFEVTVANNDWENTTVLNGTSYTDTLQVTVASQ